jgi:carboxylesterase type B
MPFGAYHGAELPYVFDTHDAWIPTGYVLIARLPMLWSIIGCVFNEWFSQ